MHVENVRWHDIHIMCHLGSPNGTIESSFVCPSLSLQLGYKTFAQGFSSFDFSPHEHVTTQPLGSGP